MSPLAAAGPKIKILTVDFRLEHDVVQVRQRARQIAALLRFEGQDQTRIATAVSEVARNALQYAGSGLAEFGIESSARDGEAASFVIRISDQGAGIPNLDEILNGEYRSKTGMGLGLLGAKRLMDGFSIETTPKGGTRIRLSKALPKLIVPVTSALLLKISEELLSRKDQSPIQELQHQNQELIQALEEIRVSREALNQANRELEETNRGMAALYAELNERAKALKKAVEIKSRFLSHMSHEFRTPINSILGLSKMLLDRLDGELNSEQEKQVTFIRKSSEEVLLMVSDLLDLAKVDAGKTRVFRKRFELNPVLNSLRALMKPVPRHAGVELVIEAVEGELTLDTDEGKITQILRNLVSNALKFNEKGEVRLSVTEGPSRTLIFSVKDTGIGIADTDQVRIFEEFSQVESDLKTEMKGTGLGLSLVKNFAVLLGGSVTVNSQPGVGSIFKVTLPMEYQARQEAEAEELAPRVEPLIEGQVLIIDDDQKARYMLKNVLEKARIHVVEAAGGRQGLEIARALRPSLVFLDFVMPEMGGLEVMDQLKSDSATSGIPIIIHTSKLLNLGDLRKIEESALAVLPKGNLSLQAVVEILNFSRNTLIRKGA